MNDETRLKNEQLNAGMFALIQRLGGHVLISIDELPDLSYSLMRRNTESGGLEFKIVFDKEAN